MSVYKPCKQLDKWNTAVSHEPYLIYYSITLEQCTQFSQCICSCRQFQFFGNKTTIMLHIFGVMIMRDRTKPAVPFSDDWSGMKGNGLLLCLVCQIVHLATFSGSTEKKCHLKTSYQTVDLRKMLSPRFATRFMMWALHHYMSHEHSLAAILSVFQNSLTCSWHCRL